MRDSMRKGDFEHSNKESNGNSSDDEENQLTMCVRKGDAENLNEKKKKNINESKPSSSRREIAKENTPKPSSKKVVLQTRQI